jgi:hypothetical protein
MAHCLLHCFGNYFAVSEALIPLTYYVGFKHVVILLDFLCEAIDGV